MVCSFTSRHATQPVRLEACITDHSHEQDNPCSFRSSFRDSIGARTKLFLRRSHPPHHRAPRGRGHELGHVGGQHRPDAAGDAQQDGRQSEPGCLLVASPRLAQSDSHAQSGRDLFHGVLQHQGCRADRAGDPAAGDDGSLNGNIVDFWQVPLEDVGPSGADAGKGGKYLLLPPGYSTPVPEGTSRCVPRRSAATRSGARI